MDIDFFIGPFFLGTLRNTMRAAIQVALVHSTNHDINESKQIITQAHKVIGYSTKRFIATLCHSYFKNGLPRLVV